jgi:hypothetical protein
MPGLGAKEDSYVDIIRDAWKPLLSRREIRQALWSLMLGLFIVFVGVGSLFVIKIPEIGPIFGGVFFIGWGASTLWSYRPQFRAWRTIGDVHLEFADGALVTGETSTLDIVVRPRRACTIGAASLMFYAKDSRGPAAIGDPWRSGLVFDAPLPSPADLPVGAETRIGTIVALEPAAPSSHFDSDYVRQWFVMAKLQTTDGREWEREYPILVYPGAQAALATMGTD